MQTPSSSSCSCYSGSLFRLTSLRDCRCSANVYSGTYTGTRRQLLHFEVIKARYQRRVFYPPMSHDEAECFYVVRLYNCNKLQLILPQRCKPECPRICLGPALRYHLERSALRAFFTCELQSDSESYPAHVGPGDDTRHQRLA